MNMHQNRISNSCLCQSQEKRKMNLTITIHFIRFILAVNFSITPQVRINTLSFLTLELRCRAYWTTILIALVITLREPITPPCHWDTVNLSSCTGKLVWGASWRFWRKRKQNTCAHSFNFSPLTEWKCDGNILQMEKKVLMPGLKFFYKTANCFWSAVVLLQ